MNAAGALERVRRASAWIRGSRVRAALAWAVVTLIVLSALAGAPGISRDEAAVLVAADPALAHTAPAAAATPPSPLSARTSAATHALLSRLGLAHLRASRIASALFGAVLSAALVLLAWELSGAAAGLLAPALYWAAPRHLHAGLVATPEVALAAFATAAVVAYRRAALSPGARGRIGAAVSAGLLFGGALAARADAWILLPVLAAHAAVARALRGPAPPVEGVEARLHGVPAALVAMAAFGPLVLLGLWPSHGLSSLARAALAFVPGAGAAPSAAAPVRGLLPRAIAVTALSVPVPLLLAYVAGAGHSLLRIVRAVRSRTARTAAPDEALLLLCATAPLVAASARVAPAVAGIRPWLHAMPFVAVLGARALLAAARVGWPRRAGAFAASLALLVLWPSIRASAHLYPAGASAWNELAGGAPGAAALGMERQDGGEAAAALLEALGTFAPQGARVHWATTAPAAVRAFVRDGRLRPDLVIAGSPEEADLAVVTLDGGSRDPEYRIWSSFRTARPAAGVYLDEVPLAFVYARPGAWR